MADDFEEENRDFDRIIKMLETIEDSLSRLVGVKRHFIPARLHPSIKKGWAGAHQSIRVAIATLDDKTKRQTLLPALQTAGMTGVMLEMKAESVDFHLERTKEAILTYEKADQKPKGKDLLRFLRCLVPGSIVINSVAGSLSRALPPLEIVKEFKDHVEAGSKVAELAAEDE
jgi:hypothetical protein